jgi:hypothetical protein
MADLGPLAQFPNSGWLTPQIARRIVDWKPDVELQSRIMELGRWANEGLLTDAEKAEYEQHVDDGDLIALFQLTARNLLGELPE